jgi:hypothetical protein
MHNCQTIMCDEKVLSPHKIPHSPRRVPKVMAQRAEEIFPALKESLVSVLCFYCGEKLYHLIPWIFMAKEIEFFMMNLC